MPIVTTLRRNLQKGLLRTAADPLDRFRCVGSVMVTQNLVHTPGILQRGVAGW